jgi:hypothetical protein
LLRLQPGTPRVDVLGCNFSANLKKVFPMLNFLEVAARVVAGLVVAALLLACMLSYFDVLVA